MTNRTRSINPIGNRLSTPLSVTTTNATEFVEKTAKFMDSMPNLLNQWQANDLANNEVGGYHTNPVSTISLQIKTVGTTITSNTIAANIANLTPVYTAAVAMANNAQFMKDHTDRISGVVEPTADTIDYPHYSTAIGVGQMMMYITNQLDGTSNNSTMLGSFGSVMLGNTLTQKYQTVETLGTTVINSIVGTTVSDGLGGFTTSYETSLTPSQVNTIRNTIFGVANDLFGYVQTDINYYNSCKTVTNDYNKVNKYSKLGQTETYLLTNFVGSTKLKTRLNSQ